MEPRHQKHKSVSSVEKSRMDFEGFISRLSTTFINLPYDEINMRIQSGLEELVEFLRVSKCGILDVHKEGAGEDYIFAQDGFETYPEEYQPIKFFPWWTQTLRNLEIISWPSLPESMPTEEAERERMFCVEIGVKSMLSIPVSVAGAEVYVIFLTDFKKENNWTNQLIKRLTVVGEIFANALKRKKQVESLNKAFTEIKELKDQLEADYTYLREEIQLEHNYEEIIGGSASLKSVLSKAEQVASTDSAVLIQGETGVGKELIARAIHSASNRKDRPLIKVNCATLPANLIESELFGHEKGAFTGAHASRIGRFELADKSTLFLDEIGELPLELQPKLLRVLQEGEFERVGSMHTKKTDVRIISATNRDLEEEAKEGRFRHDLWFRLNVFPITVPPLRERREDIPTLVKWFVKKLAPKMGKEINAIHPSALKSLKQYNWPGNVRELEHVIERAIICSRDKVLVLMDELEKTSNADGFDPQQTTMAEMERAFIVRALMETDWKIEGANGAAMMLDLNPSTLRARIKKHKINRSIETDK